MNFFKLIVFVFVVVSILCVVESKKKRRKIVKSMILRQKETNPIDFIRLTVMRLVYGLANRLGFGEQISEALNGAFVPPGVDPEYDDYGGDSLGLLDREDDYDY